MVPEINNIKEGKPLNSCFFCKSDELLSTTTYYLLHIEDKDLSDKYPDGHILMIKNVPCQECVQCGEKYYESNTIETLEVIYKEVGFSEELTKVDFNDYLRE